MSTIGINRHNVGRIAERIVSNELEFRGFRVSDLNKEGTSANADLLAAKDGRTWQIQVKGATYEDGWWFGYGRCAEEIISKTEPMFNKCRSDSSFYKATAVRVPRQAQVFGPAVNKAIELAGEKNMELLCLLLSCSAQ
jgi:hypothetical protein